jgi:uncharacterized protein YheU (UPF0270 family)
MEFMSRLFKILYIYKERYKVLRLGFDKGAMSNSSHGKKVMLVNKSFNKGSVIILFNV